MPFIPPKNKKLHDKVSAALTNNEAREHWGEAVERLHMQKVTVASEQSGETEGLLLGWDRGLMGGIVLVVQTSLGSTVNIYPENISAINE